jgi:hypothetical protein
MEVPAWSGFFEGACSGGGIAVGGDKGTLVVYSTRESLRVEAEARVMDALRWMRAERDLYILCNASSIMSTAVFVGGIVGDLGPAPWSSEVPITLGI